MSLEVDVCCECESNRVCFVRELYPVLLKKSDRGKKHNPLAVPTEYGQISAASGVDGVELLEAYEKGEIEIDSDGKKIEGK